MSKRDSTSAQIVWRDLNRNPVTLEHPDPESPHLAGHRRQDIVAIGQVNAKRRARQHFGDSSFELDCFFLRHGIRVRGLKRQQQQ